jgi:hypothetical protein
MRTIALLCIAILVCSCQQRPPENTRLTNLVLDRYSPSYRFGERFNALKRSGEIVELEGDAGHATMNVHFPQSEVGFRGVRILGRLDHPDSLNAAIATDFTFYASPESSRQAAQAVRADLLRLLGASPKLGCSGTRKLGRDSVLIWEGEKGGGAALLIPESNSSSSFDRHVTRLLIYPNKVYVADLVGNFERRAC